MPGSNRARFCKVCAPPKQGGGSNPRRRIQCAHCGRTALVKPTARFCSHGCYTAATFPNRPAIAKKRRAKLRRALVLLGNRSAAEARLAAAAVGSAGTKPWIAGRCGSCGDNFVGQAVGLSFCSRDCMRREIRRRRRAALRGAIVEMFDPVEIFERDGWRCKLCGKAVARAKAVPHPKAPVLDHILPLTHGGQHSRANTQCAHFLCNSIKSERVYGSGEQLRLIG